ncbi:Uncharacterized protein dnm_013210 [Desulfonema magnum]|uniref:Uncharacterized protein n=1 Tax=Desulfonema magnum TaxID=45655 RepID=A0A975GKZ6_9BACT|nr:Uncharacterized protein dnm_013210 [Desulfonema magnum]
MQKTASLYFCTPFVPDAKNRVCPTFYTPEKNQPQRHKGTTERLRETLCLLV